MMNRGKLEHILAYARQQKQFGSPTCRIPPGDMVEIMERLLAQPVSGSYTLNSPVFPDGWVSCEDRMPEEGDVVLVLQEGGIIFCAEVDGGEFYPDEFPRVPTQGREITHWMPLPASPEGGNG